MVALRKAARTLADVRAGSKAAFETAIIGAARDLAFSDARFIVKVEDLPESAWTHEGPQHVEFLFTSSAGDVPRPLAKIASGGEISRVMLALKDVLGQADRTPVLVFDEVDAGIGGATALAVGRRARVFSARRTRYVVNAPGAGRAFATHQWWLRRGAPRTVASPRADSFREERVAEVARMLSGVATHKHGHARELSGARSA